MAIKVSEYVETQTVFNNNDLFDVSAYLGVDSYESRKTLFSTLKAAMASDTWASILVSTSQTAANNTQYIVVANATFTDPITPAEGKGFKVYIRYGTATINSVGYSVAGTIIYRVFHSGAWATYVSLGVVNSGTQYRLAHYANNGTAVSENAAITAARALKSDANGLPTHFDTTTEPSLTELARVKNLGSQAVGVSDTNTLTNKRITARTGTVSSSATPTINTDNIDIYLITAQLVNITSFTTNLSGTPTEGQTLWIAITGTAARAITWGSSFESSGNILLPTTTISTTRLDVAFIWNSVTSKWRCVGVA